MDYHFAQDKPSRLARLRKSFRRKKKSSSDEIKQEIDTNQDQEQLHIESFDKDKTYKLEGDSDNNDYYEITEHKSFSSTFTCCGWSRMNTSNRILGYLAAVGYVLRN